MNCFEAPRERRMPISRVRSVMVVYIERKITRTPIQTATKTTVSMNASNAGILVDIISFAYSLRGIAPYVGKTCFIRSITVWT